MPTLLQIDQGQDWLASLLKWDRDAFISINVDGASAFGDWLFPILRNASSWIPLYVLLVALVIYRYKWKALVWIVFLGLIVLVADQLSSSVIKPYFGRIRPCNEPLLRGTMRMLLPYCGGNGSFTSSHAVNHFALAVFFQKTLKPFMGRWALLFYVWAVSICYAQVYVGAHYPGDVLAGALLGALIGSLFFYLFKKYFYWTPADTGKAR